MRKTSQPKKHEWESDPSEKAISLEDDEVDQLLKPLSRWKDSDSHANSSSGSGVVDLDFSRTEINPHFGTVEQTQSKLISAVYVSL
jgi:hypothetical protein